MSMDKTEMDHAGVTLWRCGVGWMVGYYVRDERGDLIAQGAASLPSTARPTSGVSAETALWRVLLEVIASDTGKG